MKIKYLIAFLLILVIGACEFDDGDIKYNFGNDFIDDPTNVIMIDTLTLLTYTTKSDSFSTSMSNRLLSGRYTNEIGIETYAEAYFRFETSDIPSFHSTAVYDSACLLINLDGYHLGDTTLTGDFDVFRLSEEIVLNGETNQIYNVTQFQSEPTSLGSFKVDFNETQGTISLKMPGNIGEELFNFVYTESDTIIDNDLFNDFLKGLVIRPTDDNSSFVMGISAIADSVSSPRIRVYYHDFSINDELYFDFPLENYNDIYSSSSNSNFYSYSYIKNDYSGTLFEGIQPGEAKHSSSKTDNVTVVQSGTMLFTRIEIPYIDNLYDFGLGAVIKAELYLEPMEETYSEQSDLPPVLIMNLVNDKNSYYRPLYVTGSEDQALGYLNFNKEFKSKTEYTYDITNYVKTEYEDLSDPEYSLMLTLPYDSEYPNVDQLVIGDNKNVQNRLKLKVYLTKF